MSAPILAMALILDALLGEPRPIWARLPHPAVLMGRAVSWADRHFNQGPRRKLKGAASFALLAIAALILGLALPALPGGTLLEITLTAILLAHRSLCDHVQAVSDALRLSPGDARLAVARIVGRDTTRMDSPAIARAAIESAAENFSDGVVAPVFWFLVGGLPGLLLYKMTNTADSMIGYRTQRYEEFGWAAARFDDLLNWLPARLSAVLIAVAHGQLSAWPGIRADAALHRSPNAGWPEAAMSRVVNAALAGPRSYSGRMQQFPFVNPQGRTDIGPAEIDAAVAALWRVWALLLALVVLLAAF